MAVHQVGDLARFPLTIYPTALKAVLGFLVPFAFISTFPMSWLLDTGGTPWLGLLTPLVAACCAAAALLTFGRGLRRYESAGN
jgi:ABC-2 type transport system permease protein